MGGPPAAPRGLRRAGRRDPLGAGRGAWGTARSRSPSKRSRCPRRGRSQAGEAAAGPDGALTVPRTPAPRGRPQLSRPRAPALRPHRARPRRRRGSRRCARVAALLAACAESGVAVRRSAAARASSAEWRRLAGDHSAVVSPRPLRPARRRGGPHLARRPARPGLRAQMPSWLLGERGATLGHFPQSYELATIGGYAATRSAGQVLERLRALRRAGHRRRADSFLKARGRCRPHTAAGPSLRELVLGSEGTLGVITDVSCRVRPKPEARRYEGWIASTSRRGARSSAPPRAMRCPTSCASPTRRKQGPCSSLAEGLQKRALDAYLALRRRQGGCLLICGWEGEREPSVAAARWPRAGCARAGPSRSDRPPGAPGRRPVTRGPTCATSCWAWASSSRRWRPPTPGAASTALLAVSGALRDARRSRS